MLQTVEMAWSLTLSNVMMAITLLVMVVTTALFKSITFAVDSQASVLSTSIMILSGRELKSIPLCVTASGFSLKCTPNTLHTTPQILNSCW